ncbi:MAG: tRNA (adenosine(37)-N6)-dimethylallyltransferase MiaA [Candidatus Marisimplicoccus sp.]
MRKNKNLIYISGPTGVGKTDLSIEIAKKFNTEIVSCDSRQFYKELKIGTSPPSNNQLAEVKHHFIHNKNIQDVYNVGKYEKEAISKLNSLFEKNESIVLVGGSGLYANSVIYGIDDFPDIPVKIRNKIIQEYESKGIKSLQNRLKLLDSKYCEEVDLNNKNRLIRAIEIIEYTGQKFSDLRTNKKKYRNFKTHIIVIECEREILYERINQRVNKMIKEGLEEEVFNLKSYKNLNTLNTVGYKEFFSYFEDKLSYSEAVNKIKQNTRNYAKRQITWFNKYEKSIKVHYKENIGSVINKLKQHL